MNHPTRATICFAWLAVGAHVEAAAIDFDSLSVQQGFNFAASAQTACGFITSLTIGSTSLSADFAVKNPTNTSANMDVVAVLRSVDWGGGIGDAIEFQARVANVNKQTVTNLIAALGQRGQTGPPVQFNFQIFDYDQIAGKYYEAFGTASHAILNGYVAIEGAADVLSMTTTPATEVASPPNYALKITIAPSASSQSFVFATSSSSQVITPWGPANVPPMVATLGVSQITGAGATFQSTVNPGGAATSAFFEYGTSPTLAAKTTSNSSDPGSGSSDVTENMAVSNLAPQTTYYYRVVGSNAQGRTPGNILSFSTVNPQISFTNCEVTNRTFQFDFANVSNAVFSVLGTTNLSLPVTNWIALGSPTEVAPGQYQFTVPATNPARFYLLSSP